MTTVEIFCDPGLSLTAKLFAVSSDTVLMTASSVTEQSTKGAYLAEFATIPTGVYLVVVYDAGVAACAAYVYSAGLDDVRRSGNYADVMCAAQIDLMSKLAINKTVTDPATGVMTVYDDDDVTPLVSAQLYEDVAETQPYRGRGAEVRGKLT